MTTVIELQPVHNHSKGGIPLFFCFFCQGSGPTEGSGSDNKLGSTRQGGGTQLCVWSQSLWCYEYWEVCEPGGADKRHQGHCGCVRHRSRQYSLPAKYCRGHLWCCLQLCILHHQCLHDMVIRAATDIVTKLEGMTELYANYGLQYWLTCVCTYLLGPASLSLFSSVVA